jgi:hypothetical protein
MKLELQKIRTDMSNTIKAAIAEVVSLMANKHAPKIVISQEKFQVTNQQALDSKREIESLKSQLGR